MPNLGGTGCPRVLSTHRRPYRTKDGLYMAMLPYWDAHWQSFCELSGHPELLTDKRFSNMRVRLKNIDEAYRITGLLTAEKTRDEWLSLLQDSNVPHMPVSTLDELIDDPQLVGSDFWQNFEHPTEGSIRMTGSPFGFSKTPASLRYAPPHLGEHTGEVLRQAGLSDVDIDAMITAGVATTSGSSSR
nr:CoA transferase [Arenicella xantha]